MTIALIGGDLMQDLGDGVGALASKFFCPPPKCEFFKEGRAEDTLSL